MVQQTEARHLYERATTSAEKCFLFDFVPANHCANISPGCNDDPLDVGPRVQNHPTVNAVYEGWIDPDPNSAVTGPSEIEKYKIDIHTTEHDYGEGKIKVHMRNEGTYETQSNVKQITFDLPELSNPMLFAIYLTTLDIAGNYKFSRRFVLYDKASVIETDETKPIHALTANPATGHQWQASHEPMLVDWKDHFYNDWHRHTNFLWPVRTFPNISGVFEQETGVLPVSGTDNVHGITIFEYSYEKFHPSGNISVDFSPISNVKDEQVSLSSLTLEDGDTVNVTIKAKDIRENTVTGNIVVYVDASPPMIELNGLCKDTECNIYVHNSVDLVSMDFRFEALDPHGGLRQVYWKLGTTHKSGDIGHGALPVVKLNASVSNKS